MNLILKEFLLFCLVEFIKNVEASDDKLLRLHEENEQLKNKMEEMKNEYNFRLNEMNNKIEMLMRQLNL